LSADRRVCEPHAQTSLTVSSRTATIAGMASIPQKELRNNIGEVLRRAEAGEQLTITVAGRPVAQLGPARTRQWVPSAQLKDLWATAPDRSEEHTAELQTLRHLV